MAKLKSDKNVIIRTITRAKTDITLMVKKSIHQENKASKHVEQKEKKPSR